MCFCYFFFLGRKTYYVVWVCGTCEGLFKDNVTNGSTETSLNIWPEIQNYFCQLSIGGQSSQNFFLKILCKCWEPTFCVTNFVYSGP